MSQSQYIQKTSKLTFLTSDAFTTGGRINMGGLRLSTRRNLFIFFASLVLAGICSLLYYLDLEVKKVISDLHNAQKMVHVISEVDKNIGGIKLGIEEKVILSDRNEVKLMKNSLAMIMVKLEKFDQLSEGSESRAAQSTIRDGLIQFNEKLNKTMLHENTGKNQVPQEQDTKKVLFSNSDVDHFRDILGYISPSLSKLAMVSYGRLSAVIKNVREVRSWVGEILVIGLASSLSALIIFGCIIIRSMIGGVRTVANAATRMASGEKNVVILGTENIDAVGQIARSLIKWGDDLSDIRQLRVELDETRKKLSESLQESDRKVSASVEAAKAAFLAEVAAESTVGSDNKVLNQFLISDVLRASESQLNEVTQTDLNHTEKGMLGAVSIASASENVAHLSGFVTNAAAGVGRIEYLINALKKITTKMGRLESGLQYIRKEAAALKFMPNNKVGIDHAETSIKIDDSDAKGSEKQFWVDECSRGLQTINEASEKTEETFQEIRSSVLQVSDVVNQLASATSLQALEATKKLLLQSKNLQNILDTTISKMSFPKPAVKDTDKEVINESQ